MIQFSIIAAQSTDDIGKIVLGVRINNDASTETHMNEALLKEKLIKFAAQSGYSSFDCGTFYISPNVVVNSVDIAEGGMKNIYVVQGDLYLSIKDDNTGTIYASISYPFKGSATKEETAIRNAIVKISYNNVEQIFEEAKVKILSYYESHIDAYFANADACVVNGNYDEAITYLMMIPEDLTSLHNEAMAKAQNVYRLRNEALRQKMLAEQQEANNEILTTANSYIAMHQPQEALKILWNYQQGENEKQNQHYAAMVRKAEAQVSAEEREVLRKEERAYQDNRRREDRAWNEYAKDAQHRRNMDKVNAAYRQNVLNASERVAHDKTNALKQVACEYLRNNPNKVDYFRIKF